MAATVILFGATGDLALKKLLPSLFSVQSEQGFSQDIKIIALGRRPYSREDFLAYAAQEAHQEYDAQGWQRFAKDVFYYQLDFSNQDAFSDLKKFIRLEEGGVLRDHLFYLSVAPELFPEILSGIRKASLHVPEEGRTVRVVVEKPFGTNRATSGILDNQLADLFAEESIYRVDHYLGKETVQNLLSFRFANSIFEPLWNKDHIDHIQITVAEDSGIRGRGDYYDKTGAFKDFVQNHILQLLSILAMDEPESLSLDAISDRKTQILKAVTFDKESTVFGQYQGYLSEPKVDPHSSTETYAMTAFGIGTERWQGVPIYVRTGKMLHKRISEVSVQFKQPASTLFPQTNRPNVITFRLQPEEGISLDFYIKKPRQSAAIQKAKMEFCYSMAFRSALPDAYERLFMDIIEGDRSTTLRSDTVHESWRIIDDLLLYKQSCPLQVYEAGSWGPAQADHIMQSAGRNWLAHESTVCNGILLEDQ